MDYSYIGALGGSERQEGQELVIPRLERSGARTAEYAYTVTQELHRVVKHRAWDARLCQV